MEAVKRHSTTIEDVIRLQLRKPKHWNWQLTTSKSSPNIALPVIQLYDRKGALLVDTKDTGDSKGGLCCWRSPRAPGIADQELPKNNHTARLLDKYHTHLRKSRSEVHARYDDSKHDRLPANRTNSSHNFRNRNFGNAPEPDSIGDKAARLRKSTSAIFANGDNIRHHLRQAKRTNSSYNIRNGISSKSSSSGDEEDPKRSIYCYRSSSRKSLQEGRNPVAAHRRTNSDEWGRKTKTNVATDGPRKRAKLKKSRSTQLQRINSEDREESPPPTRDRKVRKSRSIAHLADRPDDNLNAEIINQRIRNLLRDLSQDVSVNAVAEDRSKRRRRRPRKEEIVKNDGPINEVIYPKYYKLCTSSAGTLVISEESFSSHRRRRRQHEDRPKSSPILFTKGDLDDDTEFWERKKSAFERKSSEDTTALPNGFPEMSPKANGEIDNSLFRNDEDVVVAYVVQEPITPSSDVRKTSGPIVESVKSFRKRQQLIRNCDSSTSSACEDVNEARRRKRKNKGSNVDSKETDPLVRLVRRLASDPGGDARRQTAPASVREAQGLKSGHDAMGANVSRHHSAKGSGLGDRRSQSSGSISCNGKNHHTTTSSASSSSTGKKDKKAKLCASLPGYLDDSDSKTGPCNNNHDCANDRTRHFPPEPDRVPPIPVLDEPKQLHWKFTDVQTLCDQGYGSERSPEDEYPPPLPIHGPTVDPDRKTADPLACYPFITPESIFNVTLFKGSRGLGLSVCGGADSNSSWPGLVRIKRLFPHQPAAECGMLCVGDLLLEANGVTLTGLTNYEALEVLRTTPNVVELIVCRPPPDVVTNISPVSEAPPPPPRRDPPSSLNLAPNPSPYDESYQGEFEITLVKMQGSLGFTLRKEDDSALGHYVRALVREPALSDGRIRPGDKIIAVNDVELSPLTHEQAVQFLRQCGNEVRLRLYHDAAQTPVATLSPTETTPHASFSRPKTHLRQEAVDMLNDLAVRKMNPEAANIGTWRRMSSPGSSPRRLKRGPHPSDASNFTDIGTHENPYACESQHEPLSLKSSLQYEEDPYASIYSTGTDECDRPSRPCFLDLCNPPNRTPIAARKPKFNFSLAHNAYELNNLDPEILDAPNIKYTLKQDNSTDSATTDAECGDSFPNEPVSMPPILNEDKNGEFSHKNPAYQSAHPQCGAECERSDKGKRQDDTANNVNLLKQKVESGGIKSDAPVTASSEYQILNVELHRGWNSRLGFSLQGANGFTYVSAVHADSVAAKDGRLRTGDRVIKVNDESVLEMSTSDIIDLLRIIRGPVCITVSRKKNRE